MKILQEAIAGFRSSEADEFPKCFNSKKEYNTWLMHEQEAHTVPRRFVCRDCTAEYQAKMRELGRCYIPLVRVERIVR